MPLDAVVVMTLGAKGDFRGRSMLRPTRLLRGILYRFLHGTSPEAQKEKRMPHFHNRISSKYFQMKSYTEKLYSLCRVFLNPNNKDLPSPRELSI